MEEIRKRIEELTGVAAQKIAGVKERIGLIQQLQQEVNLMEQEILMLRGGLGELERLRKEKEDGTEERDTGLHEGDLGGAEGESRDDQDPAGHNPNAEEAEQGTPGSPDGN